MIDVIYNCFKIFIDCFMLFFNLEVPFYDDNTIKLGVLVIAFMTLVAVIVFALKAIGIIRKEDV